MKVGLKMELMGEIEVQVFQIIKGRYLDSNPTSASLSFMKLSKKQKIKEKDLSKELISNPQIWT